MRIAMIPGCHQHLHSDADIWPLVEAGSDVLVASALLRKPSIRITRHYQTPGHYRPSYSDRETQAADLWDRVRRDDPAAITGVVARARKLGLTA